MLISRPPRNTPPMGSVKRNKDQQEYENLLARLGDVDDIPPNRPSLARAKSRRRKKPQPEPNPNQTKKPAYFTQVREFPKGKPVDTAVLKAKARSFEEQVSVQNTYDAMIALIKSRHNDIDYGLAQGLAPKNIEYESKRFSGSLGPDVEWPQATFFADDIDDVFRALSQGTLLMGPRELDLV